MRLLLQKMHWKAIIVGGLLLVAANSLLVAAEEKLPPEKVLLRDVYKNMEDVHSLHYDMTIKAETTMGDMETSFAGDMQQSPFAMKNNINVVWHNLLNKENSLQLKQYLVQNQNALVMYYSSNEKWFKQIIALGPSLVLPSQNAKIEMDAKRDEILHFVKAVKVQRETPGFRYLEVTLDAMQISDAIGAAAKANKEQNKEMQMGTGVVRLGLLAMGDIKYTIRVDKATKRITDIEMDLTEPIRKGAEIFLDSASPKNRKEMETFLLASTLKLQATYSKYNQIEKIEVPQEVRDNAKEAKPINKEGLKKEDMRKGSLL